MTSACSRAVVVGVPTTREPHFPDLPSTTQDAVAVRNHLVQHGFSVNVRATGCSVQQFQDAVTELRQQTRAGDLALIYFSGHGDRVEDLSPTPDEPWDTHLILSDRRLPDDWFGEAFWPLVHAESPGTRWVTFADACFSASALSWIDRPRTPAPVLPRVRDTAGTTEVRRLHLGAAPDSQRAPASDPVGRRYSYVTGAFLRAIALGGVSYREAIAAVAAEATALQVLYPGLPRPTCYENHTDGRLGTSPAFVPLSW
ncbi:caspase family protein [Ornithinimicrobium tianjinense]|uniref:caspase family protein n=1 Tax=Ornithinimicrobium tianjinense TaxID=1195761 RepID=UPI001E4C1200|nr:caspase family protein [Ornithinimicrobium tianjinense]